MLRSSVGTSRNSANFRANILKDNKVEGASATASFATKLNDDQASSADASGPPPGDLPNAPATDADTLSPLQWDMRQIHTPEAHAITGGSPAVLVGDIDTGIDFSHPDLQPNIDVANSANCVSGAPVPGVAAQDDNGHGTNVAGIIGARDQGAGVVGVTPGTKLYAVKVLDRSGNGTLSQILKEIALYTTGQGKREGPGRSQPGDPLAGEEQRQGDGPHQRPARRLRPQRRRGH